MKFYKQIIVVTVLTILAFSSLYSQNDPYVKKVNFQPHYTLGLGFQMIFPAGQHNKYNDDAGFGIGGDFSYRIPYTLIHVGIDGAYTVFGSEQRKEPLSHSIPDVRVDVTTTNSFSKLHTYLKFQASQGFIRPYFMGLVGFHYLATTTKIESENYTGDDEDNVIAESTDLSDIAFSYGLGGGLQIPLYKKHEINTQKRDDQPFEFLVDLRFKYLKGGEAEYLKEGDKRIDNGSVEYTKTTSKTDIFSGRIGILFIF